MNTEDSEFARIEREAKLRQVPLPSQIYDYEKAYLALKALRVVPDAIHHTDISETLEYIQGWNDCRQAMLAEQPAPVPWVGLTEEEIWETVSRIGTSDSDVNPYAKLADARAIEAKLKEKNT